MTIIALIHKDAATVVPREVEDMDAARTLARQYREQGMKVSVQGADGPEPIDLDAPGETETEADPQEEAPKDEAPVDDAPPAVDTTNTGK